MDEKNLPHHLILENKRKLSVSQVTDVDTFDENRIVLYTEDDILIIEGYDLHLQRLDVSGGELLVEGEIISLQYTGRENAVKGKGFFKRMLK